MGEALPRWAWFLPRVPPPVRAGLPRIRAAGALLALLVALVGHRAWTGSRPPAGVPVVVEVAGDVERPGLYILSTGATIREALDAAGAVGGSAEPVVDGERLVLEASGEVAHLEPSAPLLLGRKLDVNAATSVELEAVPGLGPARVAAILEERAANGLFRSVGDLDRVRGIGPATVSDLEEWLTARGAPVVEPAPPAIPKRRSSRRGPVDVNSASVGDLCSLPGIGPVLAEAIRVEREENGPFQSIEDLRRVRGIGPARAAKLEGKVVFGGER